MPKRCWVLSVKHAGRRSLESLVHRKDACGVRREAARKRTCHQAPRLAAHPVLHDDQSAQIVAERFGYTPATVRQLASELRAGRLELFADAKPGPKGTPQAAADPPAGP